MDITRKDVAREYILTGGREYTFLVSKLSHQNKRPIILLHGAGGASWYWEEWVHYLTVIGGHPTYAPDFPGHGGLSQIDIRTLGVEDYAAHTGRFITHIVQPNNSGMLPIIIGHSMGGLVAQKVAECGEAHVLILIAPAPPHDIHMRFGKDFIVPYRDYPAIARSFLGRKPFVPSHKLVSSLFLRPEKNKRMIERCTEMRLIESPKAIWQLLNSLIIVEAEKVTVPMLVMGFKKDHIVTLDVVRKIAERYPQAELHERADFGHLCPLEHGWKKAARKCLVWIDKNC